MKKAELILALLLFAIGIIFVDADSCTNEERARLKKDAAKIKMSYVEAVGDDGYGYNVDLKKQEKITYNYLKINLTNITSDFSIRISNNFNDNTTQVGKSEVKNGMFSFDWVYIDQVVKFTYEIYGSYGSSCYGEKLATGYMMSPKYNRLHNSVMCQGVTDLPACNKYITENTEESVLKEQIRDYKKLKEKEEADKKAKKSFFKEHKIAIIGVAIIVVGSGVALVINRRKRRAY